MAARRALLLAGVFLAAAALQAEEPSSSTAPFSWRRESNTAFGAGESLLYVIKYGFITGGHASLEVRSTETVSGREAFYIVSEASTTPTMDVFFKVRDKYESWMDVESLCSLRYHQKMREGRYRREVRNDYDPAMGRFRSWRKNKKEEETSMEGPLPPFVQDVLSGLYYLRTRDLAAGAEFLIPAQSSDKAWILKVTVKGIEKVKVPAGTFECWRLEPLIAGEGLFMQTGNLEVWMTTDSRRLPVLLRSKVMVGAFTAELVDGPPKDPIKN